VARPLPWPMPDPDSAWTGGPAGVEVGGWVFLPALTAGAYEMGSALRYPGDVVEQAHAIYAKAQTVLEGFGLSLADVVHTVEFLVEPALPRYRDTARVRRSVFGSRFPASTGVLVPALPHPDALLQVAFVARRGGDRRAYGVDLAHRRGWTFYPAVEAGGLVWASGVTARQPNPAGGPDTFPPTLEEQEEVVWARHSETLREAGLGEGDVVWRTDYRVPRALEGPSIPPAPPAHTLVPVARLLHPDALVEVDLVAVRGGERSAMPVEGGVQAVAKGPLRVVTGLRGEGPDPARQAQGAYARLRSVLERWGVDPSSVVRVVELLAPPAVHRYAGVRSARHALLPGATVVPVPVPSLPGGALVEVQALAVVEG